MGRLFWKFFAVFWLAQVLTAFAVGALVRGLHEADGFIDCPPPPRHHGAMTAPAPPRPAPCRPPPGPRHVAGPPLLVPMVAGSLVSLLFAGLLAWYFSRRIRSLAEAVEAVADGKLETRVNPRLTAGKDELADLGRAFDRMAERLQGVLEGQRNLLHDVSHELRSPLARLQAMADLLTQQPTRANEFIQRIERETLRMDRLVGELLSLARIDAGLAISLTDEVDVPALLTELVADAQLEAEQKKCRITLHVATEQKVMGNRELLRRALENVLRNALRYSPAQGLIEIAVAAEAGAGQLSITIADQGPGVAADDLTAIFQPFFRSANADAFAGHGLGLAICQRVLHAHGGTITASNRSNAGLLVRLSLPLST